MKRFIQQVLLFCGIVTVLIGSIFFITKKHIAVHTDYKIPENIDKIIIGHSQPECAYNDSLIKNFKNFSSSGESYFYSYYKLIPLLNNNKNIKTVFVEFTNNQIEEIMDEWIWGDKFLPFKYKLYGSFIHPEGQNILLSKNLTGFINSQFHYLKHNLKIISSNNYSFSSYSGGFLPVYSNKVDDAIDRQNANMVTAEQIHNVSEYNIAYLEKIISFCRSKNINVFLVRSPLHPKFKGFLNEQIFKNILKTRFNNTEFLDFKEYPLTNSEFADLVHLNYNGAKIFSIWFNELLEKGILTKENKQQIIDTGMSK